jgi:hypothetical protein
MELKWLMTPPSQAIIEDGQSNKDMPTSAGPVYYISHLSPDSTTAKFWVSKESKDINGRAAIVPSGGILGGGCECYTGRVLPAWVVR